MNILTPRPQMTLPAFLDWVGRQEGRFEFKNGQIQMMTGATRGHLIVTSGFMLALASSLDRRAWLVGVADFGVRIGEDVRYPDILVEPIGGQRDALLTDAPVLIVEVLSPSSLYIDMRDKAEEYTSLSSLAAYVVASQDEPRIWLWLRGEDGSFPKSPDMVFGPDGVLAVPKLGVALRLGEIYAALT
jgi:Uma2 family endonuclease